MIVVDASVLADFLIDRGARGDWARERLSRATVCAAPELIDLEVASVVRAWARSGALEPARAAAVIDDLGAADLRRYPTRPLLTGIWSLRDRMTVYDASYVVLAAALEAPLLSGDRRLARSARGLVEVETGPAARR